jgi:hypothetical protein
LLNLSIGDWRVRGEPPAFCSASPGTSNEFRQQQLRSLTRERRAQETAKTNQVKRALKIALVHVFFSLASTIARGATPCVVLHERSDAFSIRLKLLSRIILVSNLTTAHEAYLQLIYFA